VHLRDRLSPTAVLNLANAARSWRNGQPEARQEWACGAVATVSPIGRLDAERMPERPHPEGEISRLDPRAVFSREAALIL
jgi:hypothetical protein